MQDRNIMNLIMGRESFQSKLWGLILMSFILLLVFSNLFDFHKDLVIRIISPLFAVMVIIRFTHRLRCLPPEVLIFSVFILWSACGFFISTDRELFFKDFRFVAQSVVLMAIIALIVSRYGNLKYIFFALFFIAFVLFAYELLGKNVIVSEEGDETFRLAGLIDNANGFGYLMFLGAALSLFWWNLRKSLFWRILLVGFIIFFFTGIIYSASRNAFLTFAVFITLWLFFCFNGVSNHNRIFKFFSILSLIYLLKKLIFYVLNHSYIGSRIIELQYVKDSVRYELYLDGFRMLISNPLFGVGLGNFFVKSSVGGTAHSDLMEVFSSTGVIGGILYLSIYFVLWKRISRIKIKAPDLGVKYEMDYMHIFLICYFISGFGKPQFLDIFSMILLSGLIGYTYFIEEWTKNELRHLKPS